jgi:transcriptional regulator with XRE-family HTH domain
MYIGRRLRELRLAKGMSLGDLEQRTGIFRSYVSRVELGFIMPQLPTLEKWVKALDISLAEFFAGHKIRRKPTAVIRITPYEKRLFECLGRVNETDRRLWLSAANTMAKQGSKHGGPK